MVTRIRYYKQNNNLISRECFIKDNVKYYVFINQNELTFKICTQDEVTNLYVGRATKMSEIKRQIKVQLRKLGFNFKTEKRQRKVFTKKENSNTIVTQE